MRSVPSAPLRSLLLCALALAATGCGSAAPATEAKSPSPEPSPANSEPDAVGSTAASEATEEAAPSVPRARIMTVREVPEAPGDRRVKIEFENPTGSSCRFTSYTMVWPGGRKTVEEKPFEIPPGGKRMRSLRMHPNDGDLSSLSTSDSEIEVSAGCSAP